MFHLFGSDSATPVIRELIDIGHAVIVIAIVVFLLTGKTLAWTVHNIIKEVRLAYTYPQTLISDRNRRITCYVMIIICDGLIVVALAIALRSGLAFLRGDISFAEVALMVLFMVLGARPLAVVACKARQELRNIGPTRD